MSIFSKGIDQVCNRFTGLYKGVVSPKSPNTLIIPSFLVVEDGFPSLAEVIDHNLQNISTKLTFNKSLIVADPTTWDILGQQAFEELKKKQPGVRYTLIKSNNIEEVNRIVEMGMRTWKLEEKSHDRGESNLSQKYGTIARGAKKISIIYGIGGGSVIDVAKYAAYKLNIPYISIPTSLSNDGFASPFAVLNLNEDGVSTLKANVPLGVIINISTIKSDDPGYTRRIRSGIGDLLSNMTASMDWELAQSLGSKHTNYEKIDIAAKYQAQIGAEATLQYIASDRDVFYSTEFLQHLALSLIFSAEAMGRYGSSRPASGFEHKIFHMYNRLKNYKPEATHGELVAIGSLISAKAHKRYFKELQAAFKKVGLPTTVEECAHIGVTMGDLKEAIRMCQSYRKERYTIFDSMECKQVLALVDTVFK
ncbi:MAG: hypothetical protein CSA81_09635 [Acidobacteria bacterium]|nr:MAG: hypothetical protein CSA81_09635 [Acidobacteriota bacterium]PIE89376.1 MAG: hypothetical protein CR997_11655 [Acidobacteriota bacterium]